MRIIIAGGGIVGLTTALSLAAAGLRPTVYEAVDEIRPLGVGINLLPHAVRELTELGLLAEVEALGVPIDSLTYHMQDGREVWTEARGRAAGHDWPQVAIHRGRFQHFLLGKVREALGAGAIVPGHALAGFTQGEHAVRARFERRGTGKVVEVEGDVLIGADGIHSALRRQLYPAEGRPIWNGVNLYRSTTRLPIGAFGPRMLWVGYADQKFIAYPIEIDRDRGEVVLNWVADLRTAEPGATPQEEWNRSVDPAFLRERYADWAWDGVDIPAILAGSGTVYEFPMVDRDPLPRWSHGRVTLAGDAAHPMYPIGSNGATQGIIDARALAWCLATVPDVPAALQRYEDLRREPTARIVQGNRAQGPDVVLEMARQRAADPAVDLSAVLPLDERGEVADRYKRLAGFDPETLKVRASFSVKQPAA